MQAPVQVPLEEVLQDLSFSQYDAYGAVVAEGIYLFSGDCHVLEMTPQEEQVLAVVPPPEPARRKRSVTEIATPKVNWTAWTEKALKKPEPAIKKRPLRPRELPTALMDRAMRK